MGGCFSSPTGCVKCRTRLKRPNGTKNRRLKNRGVAVEHSAPPSVVGSAEEVWFDPLSLFGSDSEEDFRTVPDADMLSINGSEDTPSSMFSSPIDAMNKEHNLNIHQHHAFSNVIPMPEDLQPKNMAKYSSVDELSKDVEHKRETLSMSKDYATLLSSKILQKRPVAGSQVPICPIGKEIFDSWSPIEPSTFRVRGTNYLRDKKKEHASNKAAYYPFGVDIYLSQRKINHIAKLVELPAISSSPTLPALLVVNVQIPLHPPTIFQKEDDGEGMNVVMYFKLSDRFDKESPLHFRESIRRLIDNEVEKIKGFPTDTIVPFREKLKILSRVANVDDLQLNAPQRKLMNAYNGKPILSRPQHEFYSGENYFEIDIDMHRFSYISRKGFNAFQDELKICILDVGLTIQGNKVEELPEQVLCCLRVNGIDHTNYSQLEPINHLKTL
ncbi:hypothetical protein QQ045_019170 [Rhodiola kirilowii]